MSDVHERLTSCFANVFPELPPEQIPHASAETVSAWDSVTHITLLSAVSEEFGVDFDAEDFEELVSFPLMAAYLAAH